MTLFLVYLAKRKHELHQELKALNKNDALAQRLLIRRSLTEIEDVIMQLPEDMRLLVNELAELRGEI